MKRLFVPLILFFLLVSEGIALGMLPQTLVTMHLLIVPHWVFIFLLLVHLFYDSRHTYFAIIYAICFGLLIDIVYTGILGAYMFVYATSIYIVHLLKQFLQTNLTMTIVIAIISISIVEGLLFVIYSIIALTNVHISDLFLLRIVPTVLANIIFLIPMYFIFVKLLTRWGTEHYDT